MRLDTPEAELGWLAAPFELPDPDGETFSMTDLMGEDGLLVAFICNHCPYVKAIIGRLVADAKVLQDSAIGVAAINSNDFATYTEDSPDNMRAFAKRHAFTFPYLIDEDQSVARIYGAVCTPDFFGFNSDGALCYRGRLDDARMGDGSGREAELLNAMQRIKSTGSGPEAQHASIGCSIKWR